VGIDKINIGPGRWGLLPFSVQAFLHEDNNKCIAKSEEMEKEKTVFNKEDVCLLRYGVEKNDKQSFLGCVAVMYAHKHKLEKIPSIKEINQFKEFLFRHINIIKPNAILLLGATAAEAVLKYAGPLSKIRGKWKNIKITKKNFNVLVTFHPAFLLRQSLQKRFFLKDLKILKKKITNR
jgi:uracil-DNA glycosylase